MKTDLSALKFNQISVVTLTALALALRMPWLSGLLGLAMLIGAAWPVHSPLKAAYRALGPVLGLRPQVVDEAPQAHQFAQGIGGSVLLLSALSGLAGLPLLSAGLGLLVIILALLNLTTRICVGCLLYFQWRLLQYRLTH
ncbi:DUF4395 domain-containing protein [Deinococcus sonorensis]|uniref:DUF4395 domain-containing protein n=2 Tax=Deinococcus sonorensis TaxID=309891 RepID=A0AAU7U958_9DEIO